MVLTLLGGASALGFDVEFPGPVAINGLGNTTAAVTIPWPEESSENLVIGGDDGILSFVRLLSGGDNFSVFYHYFGSGQVVWMDIWENPTQGDVGIVVATANPDRITFYQVQYSYPNLVALHQVDLPEDPGAFSFVGPTFPGGQELAVSLPGIDQIAILKLDGESWGSSQILDAGDGPRFLVGFDLEQDGVREVITADQGVLSGNLGIFRRDTEGVFSRTGQYSVGGTPTVLRAFDIDNDSKMELAVALANEPVVQFLESNEGQLLAAESVDLALPSEKIHFCPLPDGGVGMFSSVESRGLVEFLSLKQGVWNSVESYYPGCRPSGVASGDLNGDGNHDLISLGSEAMPTSVMFGNPEARFWGFPALTLNSTPGSTEMADFDLDGNIDLVVGGMDQPLLSFFSGKDDGSLASVPFDQDLGYLFGGLVALEAGGSEGMELALLDFYTGQLRIMDYTPDSGFQTLESQQIQPFPSQLRVADLDGDGNTDLFMARSSASDLLILYGDGTGNFGNEVSFVVPTGSEDAIAIHLDTDNLLDLVVVDGIGRVYSYINLGDGSFELRAWTAAGTGARYLAVGDLDGDLDLDVVVGNRIDKSVTFLENDSTGTLVRRIGSHALSGTPSGIACSDLNHTGNPDVLVNLGDEGNIGIIFGLGDWSFGMTLRFPGGANINSFRLGDFNLDGNTDVLNLDQSLHLGLTMLNVDRVLVSVDPTALAYHCDENSLSVTVLPDRYGPWDLEIGSALQWIPLAQTGQQRLGRLDFDGRVWRVKVAWEDLADMAWDQGTPVELRLSIGEESDRESLVLELDPGCAQPWAASAPSLLSWAQEPWPNPFNPSVQSRVHLEGPAQVSAEIYDLTGRRVATLLQGELTAGTHTMTWDGTSGGRPTAAGMYFLRITGPGTVLSRKILLLK